ncbi:unnamed protein product [Symbiodinium necroappetens]|uniref:Uncharacterized protein n=1 Tax=Symbiodinium necroappetens TaxID=1628268 RepID=A0A813A2V7_9DINO|nr:unnamed protein product [Symbiodinium necroappetens]
MNCKTELQESQQQEPAAQEQQPAPIQQQADSGVEVLKSPSARGSKRPHPVTPPKDKSSGAVQKQKSPSDDDDGDDGVPKIMSLSSMTKLEKEKVKRIVTPKRGSGNLEVPENIFEMWKDAGKGRDNLFRMWAKAGGAVFMESVTILTKTSRSKKLEVKGGFYSKEDMTRVDKVVAWATKKGLFRTCEYDDETLEYWVNIRTTGTLTKEDTECLERQQNYQGEGGDDLRFKPGVHVDGFIFSDDDPMIHGSEAKREGGQHKSAPAASQIKEYMKQVLRAKSSMEGFVDKIRTAVPRGPKEGKAKQLLA